MRQGGQYDLLALYSNQRENQTRYRLVRTGWYASEYRRARG
jgi:hypothetical protein